MAFAAAEHDQVDAAIRGDTHELGLDVAGLHDALRLLEAGLLRQLGDAPRGALDQFAFDLHGRQQGLAHRFDGDVFDDVQQDDFGPVTLGDVTRPLGDLLAAFGEVHSQQDLLVFAHGVLRGTRSSGAKSVRGRL